MKAVFLNSVEFVKSMIIEALIKTSVLLENQNKPPKIFSIKTGRQF